MTERWKYQIKTGLPFGILVPFSMSFFRSFSTSIEEEFLSMNFLIQLVIFLLGGIFAVGYYNWKEKVKKDSGK